MCRIRRCLFNVKEFKGEYDQRALSDIAQPVEQFAPDLLRAWVTLALTFALPALQTVRARPVRIRTKRVR